MLDKLSFLTEIDSGRIFFIAIIAETNKGQYDATNDEIIMMHGIRAKRTDWLKNFKLPHVFVNDVWEMCAKTSKYNFTRPVLSLMAGLILFGADRGYNEALDDGKCVSSSSSSESV